jgi:PTS system ascorbate-specific IIC component
MAIIDFLVGQIFGNAAVLFGLISLIGLLLLRKPLEDIVVGVAKTIIGFLILLAGANVLSAICTPIASWVGVILGVEGVQPNMWVVLSIGMSQFGREIGIALTLGFLLNILLARVLPWKGVNVTGHIMLLWAAWTVTALAGLGYTGSALITISTIVCGVSYWFFVVASRPFMKDRLTSEWALCMPNITGIALTSWLSRLIGDPKKSCEDIPVSDRFAWVRDSVVSIAIFGSIIWLILGILAGRDAVQAFSGSQNWIIYLLLLGAQFSAGIAVVLYGVRMLIAEIVPAFNGITKRLLPGSIMGLDYPTVFTFAPTAVFIGFFCKLAGAVVGTVLQAAFHFPVVVLPSVFMDFWDGALMGVFADRFGGRRAVVLVTFVLGIAIQLMWGLSYPFTGEVLTGSAVAMDYPDSGTFGLLLLWVARLFGGGG